MLHRKFYKKSIITLTLLSMNTAHASSVVCPATAKIGTQLTITANLDNTDCNNSLSVNRTVASVIGNSGYGTIGLQGPFVTNLPNNFIQQIEQASCNFVPWDPNNPQFGGRIETTPTTQAFSISVLPRVPASWAGTLVAVSAGALDINNHLKIAGICHVQITR